MVKALTKDKLKRLYIKEGKSLAKIAEILSCAPATVQKRCREYGIKIREPKNIKGVEKVLRSVYFDKEQLGKLDRLSAKTRVPKAVYIRDAIDLVLNKYEKKLRSGVIKREGRQP